MLGFFSACSIHCVSSGVRVRRKFPSVILRWTPFVFFNKFRDLVIGDLVQS